MRHVEMYFELVDQMKIRMDHRDYLVMGVLQDLQYCTIVVLLMYGPTVQFHQLIISSNR
jgi:hypothetical protein